MAVLFLQHGNTAMRNYAANGTFISAASPPCTMCFRAVKQSGSKRWREEKKRGSKRRRGINSCDVTLCWSYKRSTPSEEKVPRELESQRERESGLLQITGFTHLQLQ